MISRELQEAIAAKFVELYDAAFTNPFAEYDNLFTLLREDDPADPADDALDAVFSFPQEQALFNSIDAAVGGASFIGYDAGNSLLTTSGNVLDYFNNSLTRLFPLGSEILEIIPGDGDQDSVAVRLRQSGVGSQTGRPFEQPGTWIIRLDEEAVNALDQATVDALLNGETTVAKVITRVEFYSNAYPVHSAALDTPNALQPPGPPADDPLTYQEPYRFDQNADPVVAANVATQMWESLAVGDIFTASTLHAAGAVWSFAIGGPSFLPYVGTAEGFTSDGQPLAPDFSNLGEVLGNILVPLGRVVAPGALTVTETFAEGNRVLVHLVEQTDADGDGVLEAPFARETGVPYVEPLDILSWITVEDGRVVSNEVIVNTFATVNAVRPGENSPFGFSLGTTRHSAPYFVTGSRVNSGLITFDEEGNFQGILYEGNSFDSPELQQPIGITYGPDGYLYVNSTLGALDNSPLINAVLRYPGVYGDYEDGTTQDNREPRDRARDAVTANLTPRLQNVDPTRVADDPSDPADQPNDYNPALVGNAHGEYYDPLNGRLIDPGSLTVVTFASGLDSTQARVFDMATDTVSTLLNPADPGSAGFVFADGSNPAYAYGVAEGPTADFVPSVVLFNNAPVGFYDGDNYVSPADGSVVFTYDEATGDLADPATGAVQINFDPLMDPRLVFDQTTHQPVGLAVSGLVIPSGIKFGPDGNLYVASAFSSRILQYDGETGDFLSVFGTRPNGVPVANVLDPAAGLPPDFTVFVFGPDGGIYQGSIRTDIDPVTGLPENGDPTTVDTADGYGAVLRFPGPTWEVNPATGNYIDPLTGKEVAPGSPAGIATVNGDLSAFGVFGDTGGILSAGAQPLYEPSAVAFGPDLNLYVASAQTAQILRYAGPINADGTPNPNAGEFLGVYVDVDDAIRGDRTEPMVLSGMGFGPDGNLYVASSFETDAGAPTAGSQITQFVGPSPGAFGEAGNPGDLIGAFGDVTTEGSRLLLPTTPEFVFFENSYVHENQPTARFPEMAFVVGVNTDRPNGVDENGNFQLGFFQSDETDTLAAYDKDLNFLGYLGGELEDGQLPQDVSGVDNPLDGVGGVIMGPNGDILVSSQLGDQILRYSSLTGEYLGVFGDADADLLDFPAGLTVGYQNEAAVYVSDLGHGRILRFDGYTGAFLDDPDTADVNEGVVAELEAGKEGWRLTDIIYGPDGRLYVGLNTPFGAPGQLGQAEVRAYNPETGALELQITGLDFAATLDFGPDNLLYIGDDPASLGLDPATGQPFVDPETGQFKESSIVVYEVPMDHPLLQVPDPGVWFTGGMDGTRPGATRVNEFNVGFGNAGGMSLTQDANTGNTLLFLSRPYAGDVVVYNTGGQILHTLAPNALPSEAMQANGGVDADGRPRHTGSVFLSEFLSQSDYLAVSPLVPTVQPGVLAVSENSSDGIVVGSVTATDPDLDSLTFTIVSGNLDQDGDGRRPFAIDAATGQITVRDGGDLNFEGRHLFDLGVVANDGTHASAPSTIRVELQNVNEWPVFHPSIPDRGAVAGVAFSFTVPESCFTDPDDGALNFSASTAGGGPLPAWLSFDSETRTFTGTPSAADEGLISLAVTATDTDGLAAMGDFSVTVLDVFHFGSDDADEFRFGIASNGMGTINDVEAIDGVAIQSPAFGGGLELSQALLSSQLVQGTAALGLYDPAGSLSFDPDGNGSLVDVQVARLTSGAPLTAANILVA